MITRSCPFCHSADIVKNGHLPDGRQKFHCKACGRYSTLDTLDAERRAKREMVEKLHVERVSQRGIARATGISRSTIITWLKKKAVEPAKSPPTLPARPEIECDEMWSFVGAKDRQAWIWLALERTTRQIVGWACGDRTTATCRLLWASLPAEVRRRGVFYTDGWEAYQDVFPYTRHWVCSKDAGQTSHIERFNNTLRQRVSGLVRKTLSFSKDFLLHGVRIQLMLNHLNEVHANSV